MKSDFSHLLIHLIFMTSPISWYPLKGIGLGSTATKTLLGFAEFQQAATSGGVEYRPVWQEDIVFFTENPFYAK
jgi:hypothetical protein